MTESPNEIDDLDEVVPAPSRTKKAEPEATVSPFVILGVALAAVAVGALAFLGVRLLRDGGNTAAKECVEIQNEIRDLMAQAPAGGPAISDSLGGEVSRLGIEELRDVCSYNETVVFEVEEVFPWFGETPPSTDSPAPTDTES